MAGVAHCRFSDSHRQSDGAAASGAVIAAQVTSLLARAMPSGEHAQLSRDGIRGACRGVAITISDPRLYSYSTNPVRCTGPICFAWCCCILLWVVEEAFTQQVCCDLLLKSKICQTKCAPRQFISLNERVGIQSTTNNIEMPKYLI